MQGIVGIAGELQFDWLAEISVSAGLSLITGWRLFQKAAIMLSLELNSLYDYIFVQLMKKCDIISGALMPGFSILMQYIDSIQFHL